MNIVRTTFLFPSQRPSTFFRTRTRPGGPATSSAARRMQVEWSRCSVGYLVHPDGLPTSISACDSIVRLNRHLKVEDSSTRRRPVSKVKCKKSSGWSTSTNSFGADPRRPEPWEGDVLNGDHTSKHGKYSSRICPCSLPVVHLRPRIERRFLLYAVPPTER